MLWPLGLLVGTAYSDGSNYSSMQNKSLFADFSVPDHLFFFFETLIFNTINLIF